MNWKIVLTVPARIHLNNIKDTRIREQISKRIDALAENPEKQGKSLGDEFFGLRSVRAVKERYRIIYKIEEDKIIVLIMLIGSRKDGDKKDVYTVAKKLHRPGLLEVIDLPKNEADEDDKLTKSSEPDNDDRSEALEE